MFDYQKTSFEVVRSVSKKESAHKRQRGVCINNFCQLAELNWWIDGAVPCSRTGLDDCNVLPTHPMKFIIVLFVRDAVSGLRISLVDQWFICSER